MQTKLSQQDSSELKLRIQSIIAAFKSIDVSNNTSLLSSTRVNVTPSTRYPIEKTVNVKFYNPSSFVSIQALYATTTSVQSICEDDQLKCIVTPGKSGALLLFSNHNNQRFVLKTVTKTEGKTLRSMLPEYVTYLHNNAMSSTLCKFFLFFKFKFHSRQVRIVIMNHVFDTDMKIARTYDLKGSLIGRTSNDTELQKHQYKDQELIHHLASKELTLYVKPSIRQSLLKQLHTDVEFLMRHKIMDYSLLLGIVETTGTTTLAAASDAMNQRIVTLEGDKIILLGIIDILQFFNAKKQVAMTLKGIKYGDRRDELSTVPPAVYAQRFYEFVEKVITTSE